MDPNDQRSKRPSLFDGDTEPAKQAKPPERILSDIQRKPAHVRRSRWRVAVLVVVGLLLIAAGLAWRFGDVGMLAGFEHKAPRTTINAVEPPVAPASPPAGTMAGMHASSVAAPAVTASTQPSTAQILDQPAPVASAPSEPEAVTQEQQRAAQDLDKALSPGQSATTDATTADAMPAESTLRRRSAARAAPRAASSDDDVDLLTALMHHLETRPQMNVPAHTIGPPGTAAAVDSARLERRIRSCPAANTDAGLACRQRICAGHLGRSPSCPAPARSD